jgi:hypothetical protein
VYFRAFPWRSPPHSSHTFILPPRWSPAIRLRNTPSLFPYRGHATTVLESSLQAAQQHLRSPRIGGILPPRWSQAFRRLQAAQSHHPSSLLLMLFKAIPTSDHLLPHLSRPTSFCRSFLCQNPHLFSITHLFRQSIERAGHGQSRPIHHVRVDLGRPDIFVPQ